MTGQTPYEEKTGLTAAPLPVLSGQQTPSPASAPSWAMAMVTFPIVAEPYRAPQVRYPVVRAPMRKGTLTLGESGVRMEGRGVPDKNPLAVVGGFLYLAFFLLAVPPPSVSVFLHLPPWFFPVLRFTCLVVGAILSVIGEYRRIARDDSFSWDEVQTVWFDDKLRWAVLVYSHIEPNARVRHRALTLNFKEPSLCGALRDSAEQFAPGKTSAGGVAYEWTPRRRWIAIAVVVAFALFIAWAFYRAWTAYRLWF